MTKSHSSMQGAGLSRASAMSRGKLQGEASTEEAVSTPDVILAGKLPLYYRADLGVTTGTGTNVTGWANQGEAGSDYDLLNANDDTTCPDTASVGGVAALLFDTAVGNQRVFVANATTPIGTADEEFWVWAIARQDDQTNNTGCIAFLGVVVGNNNDQLSVRQNTSGGDGRLQARDRFSGSSYTVESAGASWQDGEVALLVAHFASNTSRFAIVNNNAPVEAVDDSGNTTSLDSLCVGNPGGSNAPDLALLELGVVKGSPDSGELAALYASWNDRYAAAGLPTLS